MQRRIKKRVLDELAPDELRDVELSGTAVAHAQRKLTSSQNPFDSGKSEFEHGKLEIQN